MTEKKNISVLMFDAAFPYPVVGGEEKQALLLSKELQKQGADVAVLSYRHNGNKSGVVDGLPVTRIPATVFGFMLLPFLLLRFRFSFNILHIHTPSRIGIVIGLLGKALFYKNLFFFPGQKIFDHKEGLGLAFFKFFLHNMIDKLIVLEEYTLHKIKKIGIPSDKIFLTVTGVEIPEKNVSQKKQDSHKRRILFIGRLHAVKRPSDLILMADKLKEKTNVEWELNILGDGAMRDDVEQKIKKLSLETHVFCHGNVQNVNKWLERSDILVLCSESEGMSNAVLEAMAQGVPVVISSVTSAPVLLGEYAQDYIFEVGDIESFKNNVASLIEDPEKSEKYGKYLKKRAGEMFSIEAVANDFINLYESIIK